MFLLLAAAQCFTLYIHYMLLFIPLVMGAQTNSILCCDKKILSMSSYGSLGKFLYSIHLREGLLAEFSFIRTARWLLRADLSTDFPTAAPVRPVSHIFSNIWYYLTLCCCQAGGLRGYFSSFWISLTPVHISSYTCCRKGLKILPYVSYLVTFFALSGLFLFLFFLLIELLNIDDILDMCTSSILVIAISSPGWSPAC